MEIKLNLSEDYDVYELYRILGNELSVLTQDNYKHGDMIKLLEGNFQNPLAMDRLDHEKQSKAINDGKIEVIYNIRNQLEPYVEKVLNGSDKESSTQPPVKPCTKARLIDCSDSDADYGLLSVKNASLEEVQKKIYEIKQMFENEGFADWGLDDVFAQFPEEWEWQLCCCKAEEEIKI